ncbi:MAG: hypothetical protein WCA38_00215 [Candidatus Acidiferrales bacterium]
MCALSSLALAGAFAAIVQAQENKPVAKAQVGSGVPPETRAPAAAATPTPSQTIQLKAAKNTPLQIALDKKVRLQKTGQALHGRIVEGTRLRGYTNFAACGPELTFPNTAMQIGIAPPRPGAGEKAAGTETPRL